MRASVSSVISISVNPHAGQCQQCYQYQCKPSCGPVSAVSVLWRNKDGRQGCIFPHVLCTLLVFPLEGGEGGGAAGLPSGLDFVVENLWSNSLPISHTCESKT